MTSGGKTGLAMLSILIILVLLILREHRRIEEIRAAKRIKEERRLAEQRQMRIQVIRQNSRRYQALLGLSERYCFDDSIHLQYVSRKNVDSKAQFDRFDHDAYLSEQIDRNFDAYESFIQRVRVNAAMYSCYLGEVALLPAEMTDIEAQALGIPHEVCRALEKEVCQALYAEEAVTPVFLCHVRYKSPQGRNEYRQDYAATFERVAKLFEQVKERRKMRSTAVYQRRIMTASMRYEIMRRDGFRCVLCGRGAEDGVKLHVDHILPVSKGGKTEVSNLRTLCSECNMGKRDKYDEYGLN